MTGKITIKNKEEIEIMTLGGEKLGLIRDSLAKAVAAGVNAEEIYNLAGELIEKMGGSPSFKTVSGYRWATCINVNDGMVHGIPHKTIVFKKDYLVSIDVGMIYKGYHTDTSTTLYLGTKDKERLRFLEKGKEALGLAIRQAKVGNKVEDIASATETALKKAGYQPITSLTGHGIGKNLHEPPYIPCFVGGNVDEKVELKEGMVLAIEVMYTLGKPELTVDDDKWTLRTRDGKISGLFEETVVVSKHGPFVLT